MSNSPVLTLLVDRLGEEPTSVTIDAPPAELGLTDSVYRFEQRVRGELTFQLIGHDVQGHGELHAEAVADCARCLAPARCRLRAPVRLIWLRRSPDAEPDREPSPEDIMARYFEGKQIDLREPLRELIMAELPGAVYCRPDCKGLCLECGANLNLGPCGCSAIKPVSEADTGSEWKRQLDAIKKTT